MVCNSSGRGRACDPDPPNKTNSSTHHTEYVCGVLWFCFVWRAGSGSRARPRPAKQNKHQHTPYRICMWCVVALFWAARQIHHLARRQKRRPHRMHLRCNHNDFCLLVNLSGSLLGAEVWDISAARTFAAATATLRWSKCPAHFRYRSPPHTLLLHSRSLFGARSAVRWRVHFGHFFFAASAPLHSQPPSQQNVAVVAAQVPRSLFGTTSPPQALLLHSRSLFGARSESLLVARFAEFFSAANAPLHSQPPSQEKCCCGCSALAPLTLRYDLAAAHTFAALLLTFWLALRISLPRTCPSLLLRGKPLAALPAALFLKCCRGCSAGAPLTFRYHSPPHALSRHSRSLFGAHSDRSAYRCRARALHFFSAAGPSLHSQPPSF